MNLDNEDAAGSVGTETNQKKQPEKKVVHTEIPVLDLHTVDETTY